MNGRQKLLLGVFILAGVFLSLLAVFTWASHENGNMSDFEFVGANVACLDSLVAAFAYVLAELSPAK